MEGEWEGGEKSTEEGCDRAGLLARRGRIAVVDG